MFSTHVYKWNSVDIASDTNGLYHRGIVVDKTETELLVDFGIPNKTPEPIAFDKIIHDDEPSGWLACIYGRKDCMDDEVLLQLSAEQPWTWYPAEKLTSSRDSFVLVKATVSDSHFITDVVRKVRIRCRIKYKTPVRASDYLKEHVNVPYDDFVITPSFRELWTGVRYLAWTHPIGIVNRKFSYMQRRCHKSLDPSTVVQYVEDIMKHSAANNQRLERFHAKLKGENEDPLLCPGTHTQTELVISDIPHDVLDILLSHLDTAELVRYRRVCLLWDSVIASMDTTTVVTYDMSTCKNKDMYVLAALLFKFIRETTMYLVFTRANEAAKMIYEAVEMTSCAWFAKCMETAKTILDQTGITIPTLVLTDLEIKKPDFLERSHSTAENSSQAKNAYLSAVCQNLRSICQRVVLVRLKLLHLLEHNGSVIARYRNSEIPYADIATANMTRWEVRDALEPSAQRLIKVMSEQDIAHLKNWISNHKDRNENGTLNLLPKINIMQILQTWEGDDSHLKSCTWNDVKQLSNKLDALHSITILCLLHRSMQ